MKTPYLSKRVGLADIWQLTLLCKQMHATQMNNLACAHSKHKMLQFPLVFLQAQVFHLSVALIILNA